MLIGIVARITCCSIRSFTVDHLSNSASADHVSVLKLKLGFDASSVRILSTSAKTVESKGDTPLRLYYLVSTPPFAPGPRPTVRRPRDLFKRCSTLSYLIRVTIMMRLRPVISSGARADQKSWQTALQCRGGAHHGMPLPCQWQQLWPTYSHRCGATRRRPAGEQKHCAK